MMHSAFWFGYKIDDLLFHGFDIQSIPGFIFVCIVLVVFAALFEGLKLCQVKIKLRSILLRSPVRLNLPCFNDESELLPEGQQRRSQKIQLSWFMSEVGLYVLQVLLGYLLMLVVMTFNGYLSVAVLCGVGIGYGIFGFQCAEARLKMTKLKIPCHHCIQPQRESSATSTLTEGENLAVSLGEPSLQRATSCEKEVNDDGMNTPPPGNT